MARKSGGDVGTDLQVGIITKSNRATLGVATMTKYMSICEGFGTFFCLECSFAEGIPEDCAMLVNDKHDTTFTCCSCKRVCPCNRTVEYEKIHRRIVEYEHRRKIPVQTTSIS